MDSYSGKDFRIQDIPSNLWMDIATRFLTGKATQW